MIKKIMNLWRNFLGKKYKVIYSDNLKENEVLVYRHKIFVKKGEKWKNYY